MLPICKQNKADIGSTKSKSTKWSPHTNVLPTHLLWQAPPEYPVVDVLDHEDERHGAEREVVARVDAVPHRGRGHDGERAGELPLHGERLVHVDDEPVLGGNSEVNF